MNKNLTLKSRGFTLRKSRTPCTLTVLDRPYEASKVAEFDTKIVAEEEAQNRQYYFYGHDEAWYKDFFDNGNVVIAMIDDATGEIISKANLSLHLNNPNETGIPANASLRRTYQNAASFQLNGNVAAFSGISTLPDYRREGAQMATLHFLYEHAKTVAHKGTICAIVHIGNYGSYNAITKTGLYPGEVVTHAGNQKADYFTVMGDLGVINFGDQVPMPLPALDDDALARLHLETRSVAQIIKDETQPAFKRQESRLLVPWNADPNRHRGLNVLNGGGTTKTAADIKMFNEASLDGYRAKRLIRPNDEGQHAWLLMEKDMPAISAHG